MNEEVDLILELMLAITSLIETNPLSLTKAAAITTTSLFHPIVKNSLHRYFAELDQERINFSHVRSPVISSAVVRRHYIETHASL